MLYTICWQKCFLGANLFAILVINFTKVCIPLSLEGNHVLLCSPADLHSREQLSHLDESDGMEGVVVNG